jgi:hypothetical protein
LILLKNKDRKMKRRERKKRKQKKEKILKILLLKKKKSFTKSILIEQIQKQLSDIYQLTLLSIKGNLYLKK